MPRCALCGSTIVAGGVAIGDDRFCNESCFRESLIGSEIGDEIEMEVEKIVTRMREGPCRSCGGHGPNDAHCAYQVMSFLLFTSFSSTPQISCRRCGAKRQLAALLTTTFLGWWGLPWGLLFTPVYIILNLVSLLFPPGKIAPSQTMRDMIRLTVAETILRRQHNPTALDDDIATEPEEFVPQSFDESNDKGLAARKMLTEVQQENRSLENKFNADDTPRRE